MGPLLLVTLGFSGAWIGNLTRLEPYRLVFITVALVSMVFAYRLLFRPARICNPDEVCGIPRIRTAYRILFWIVAAMILVAFVYPYLLPLFY